MLFYSSSPHPVISFYNEPPYPLKIYSTINKQMACIEESLVNYHTDWVHKGNKSKKCCSMLNVLSWLRALQSHALGVRLTQTNSFLHSHAKAIIPHSYKVLHLFCWFWDSKLLLSLRTYKIILSNIIYSLFPMHSFCTLLNSKNSLSD